MPYLCTSSSESLRLTISWTNSARMYVISSVIHIKQHTKSEPKTETVVNVVKPKPNRKPVFCQTEPKSFFANRTPLTIIKHATLQGYFKPDQRCADCRRVCLETGIRRILWICERTADLPYSTICNSKFRFLFSLMMKYFSTFV